MLIHYGGLIMTFDEINKIGCKKFPYLFKTLKIKNLEIPNRLHFPPFGLNNINTDGTISEEFENYNLRLAQNGVGLIIFPNATVSADSLVYPRTLRMYDSKHSKTMKSLLKKMKAIGTVPSINLNHYGRQGLTTLTGVPAPAPSDVFFASGKKRDKNHTIEPMSLEKINSVINDFCKSAELSVEAGAEFIQVHASGGQLLQQFLSPQTNIRIDEYGGDLKIQLKDKLTLQSGKIIEKGSIISNEDLKQDNELLKCGKLLKTGNVITGRLKFLIEVFKGIRERVGESIVISARIVVDEFYKDKECIQADDYKTYIPLLEEAGVDVFMNHWAGYDTWRNFWLDNTGQSKKYILDSTQKIKSFGKKNIGFTGFVNSLKEGNEYVKEDIANLIGMGRALFIDNELIVKTLKGDTNINKCTNCWACFAKQKLVERDKPVFCPVYHK